MIVHLCIRRSLEFYVRKLEILEALKTVCTFIAKTRVFKTHLTPPIPHWESVCLCLRRHRNPLVHFVFPEWRGAYYQVFLTGDRSGMRFAVRGPCWLCWSESRALLEILWLITEGEDFMFIFLRNFFLRTIRPKFAYVLDGVKTLWNTSTFIRGIISSILLNGEVFIQEVEIKCCWQATVLECALWLEGLVEFAEARSKMRLLWSLNGNEKQFGRDTCSLQRSS